MILTDATNLRVGTTQSLTAALLNATTTAFWVYLTTTISRVISGAMNLIKYGSGTMIVTGANTYTGTTTIAAGTLQIGAGGTAGSLPSGAITNNGNLVFNRSDAVTWSNAISGTGNLTKASGSGTLTLSGNNTFNGAVTVSSGTLISTNAAGLGNGTQISLGASTRLDVRVTSGETWTMNQTLAANGTFTMANNTNGVLIWNGNITNSATTVSAVFFNSTGTGTNEFNGVIQNTTNNSAVSLTFQASQIWKLTGNNTFSGGITIGGGKVIADKLANQGNASSIGTGGVVRFGYFDNAPSTFEYVGSGATSNMQIRLGASPGTINNNASFLHNGSGALVLTNANFTLTGQGGDPATTRVLVLGGNNTDNNTIQGIIGNSGANATIQLVKSGTGTWILSGNNTYTSATSITGGTLRTTTLISGTAGKFSQADFTNTTLTVTFSATTLAGETYRLFPGATTQTYASVTLVGAGAGRTATYNSTNSTLTIA